MKAQRLPAGVRPGPDDRPRCWWCLGDPLYLPYHDGEWGFPVADDGHLFEHICLEGFQAGLSWLTVLRKREAFRRVFKRFDTEALARFTRRDVARALSDQSIIRNRAKIESVVNNARQAIRLGEEVGSLGAFFWRFEPAPRSRPARITRQALMRLTTSPEAVALSKELRRRGWTFVGPTSIYALMQSVGLVNDHLEGCHVRQAVLTARTSFNPPA